MVSCHIVSKHTVMYRIVVCRLEAMGRRMHVSHSILLHAWPTDIPSPAATQTKHVKHVSFRRVVPLFFFFFLFHFSSGLFRRMQLDFSGRMGRTEGRGEKKKKRKESQQRRPAHFGASHTARQNSHVWEAVRLNRILTRASPGHFSDGTNEKSSLDESAQSSFLGRQG